MTPTREELDALHGRMTAMTAYLGGSGAFPGTPFHYGERPAAEPAFWWRRGLSVYREAADILPAVSAELAALREEVARLRGADRWPLGTRVEKIKGSAWHGRVVGYYSTSLTQEGYAVESEREPGSVQIYPRAALKESNHD